MTSFGLFLSLFIFGGVVLLFISPTIRLGPCVVSCRLNPRLRFTFISVIALALLYLPFEVFPKLREMAVSAEIQMTTNRINREAGFDFLVEEEPPTFESWLAMLHSHWFRVDLSVVGAGVLIDLVRFLRSRARRRRRLAAMLLLLLATGTGAPLNAQPALGRSLEDLESLGGWVYDDWEAARQRALADQKPLFAVFRCVP
jgi:hypothetical protein